MIDLKIELSEEEIERIEESKDRRTKLLRVRKITGLNNATLYNYIEENCSIDNLIKCGFCGSIRKFSNFEYKIVNKKLFLDYYVYDKEINICSRKDSEKTKKCRSKILNSNSIELIKVAYDFSTDEEANLFLLKRNKSPFYRTNFESDEEYKKSQRRDEEFYGSKEIYEEKLKKISIGNKKETHILKYGLEKANEIAKSKDNSSKEFFKRKYGEDWEYYYANKNNKTSGSLDSFILRYGESIGLIKYEQSCENKRKASKLRLEKMTDEEKSLLYDTNSKKFFKRKYGEDWEEKYFEHHSNLQAKASKASNESLKFFEKLIDKISHLNLNYYIGVENNKEWFIYDNKTKRINFFDFCIKELNIIIEFHGSIWHYNPSYVYDKKLPFNMTVRENKINDEYKANLAKNNGFEYFVVFDTDNYDEKAEELSLFIFNKFNGIIK